MVKWIKKHIAMWKEERLADARRKQIVAIAQALPTLPTLTVTRAGARITRVYVNDGHFVVRTCSYPAYRQYLFIMDGALVFSVSKSFKADLYVVREVDSEKTTTFINFMKDHLKV